ncbi:HNH endonuclease, partial [Jatrophihabitans endophyticus]|uniref:HNH endonuclease n=1 Tax=Jatrophihabitans endophyticus TaxID=1206085 RepID=UPI0019E94AE1
TTPYCGAPIAHIDHARPADHGGPTTVHNGNGKCAACNHAKQAPGWHQSPGRHGTITTPTGHHYRLRPPPPLRPPERSPVVDHFWHALHAA